MAFDVSAMNQAAEEAENELRVKMDKGEIKTAQDVLQFHQRWYMKAGHKRLGRLYCKLAK
jgi:hypothetical protein